MFIGFFDIFKKDKEPQDEVPEEKFWSLSTNEGEIIDPEWTQVEEAVKHAVPDDLVFASLGYMNSDLEIEIIQITGEDGVYRFEALPPMGSYDYGQIFINDGLSYDDTIKRVKEFYDYQRVVGFKSWEIQKI